MRKVCNLVCASVLLSTSGALANEYTDGKMVAKTTSLTDMYYLAADDDDDVKVTGKARFASNAKVEHNKAKKDRADKVDNEDKSDDVKPLNSGDRKPFEPNDSYLMEGVQFGGGIGVLGGVNASVGYRIPRRDRNFWKNRFGFRLDYNTWRPLKKTIDNYLDEHEIKVDGEPVDASIKGHNFGALIDFYPFGNTWGLGNFRLSGGYYTGDFEVAGTLHRKTVLDKDVSFKVADKYYTLDKGTSADLYLDAKLRADVKGPYAGVGFDLALFAGLKFFFDAGVVFIDKPVISTDVYGSGTVNVVSIDANGQVKDEGTLDLSNLDADSKKKLEKLKSDFKSEYEDELDSITKKYFPMVKLGFLYRF